MFWNRMSFFFNRADLMFYVFIIIPIFIISILISLILRKIYKKYSNVNSKNQISGASVVRNILDSYGLNYVRIEPVSGELSDHFDPRANVVRLSSLNYGGTSIASIGVAAHEVGHAIQYQKQYFPIKFRALIIPVTNFGSKLFYPIFSVGLFISNFKLLFLGLILFSLVTFFELVTLPVEFDASARAVKILKSQNILTKQELKGVKKVLIAAALTYVVSFVSSLAQLIRLILVVFLRSNNSRDD